MYVGVAKITLALGEVHSLKEKRAVLRRIRDRVREKLNVVVNEVGELDIWQRAELGCAVVSGERAKALEVVDDVVRVAMAAGGADIVAIAKTIMTFDAPSEPVAIDDRTGAGDKAAAADDFIPDEWKQS